MPAPDVLANTIEHGQGGTAYISTASMYATHVHHHNLVQYRITSLPANGQLWYSDAAPVEIGDTFSQADVYRKRLAYHHGVPSVDPELPYDDAKLQVLTDSFQVEAYYMDDVTAFTVNITLEPNDGWMSVLRPYKHAPFIAGVFTLEWDAILLEFRWFRRHTGHGTRVPLVVGQSFDVIHPKDDTGLFEYINGHPVGLIDEVIAKHLAERISLAIQDDEYLTEFVREHGPDAEYQWTFCKDEYIRPAWQKLRERLDDAGKRLITVKEWDWLGALAFVQRRLQDELDQYTP